MTPLILNLGTRWWKWSHSRPDAPVMYIKMLGPHDRSERSEGEKEGTQVTQLNSVGMGRGEGRCDFGSGKPIGQLFVICFVAGGID